MYRSNLRYLRLLVSSITIVMTAPSAFAADPAPTAPGAPLVSSFPGPLWTVVTPSGGTASASNAHLFLNVPGGSNHDSLLPSNQAVRVVQPIGNENFDVSIKIDSAVVATDAGTGQGLMVVADDKDFIIFALGTDGTHISLSVHSVTSGVAATVFNEADFSEYQNPMYLRLTRVGSSYEAFYSSDGGTWTQATVFINSKTPTLIGLFASNYNPAPTKAVPVVMAVNWFAAQ